MPGESETHRRLKELAFLWAYEQGYRCCAMEVRAPRSGYIVDLAAIRFQRGEGAPTVALFECKQSHEDLERDNRRRAQLTEKLRLLQERREGLERLLAVHYPTLRTSDSLFPEWSTFDFRAIDHIGYRQTIRKIVVIERQLLENTKFDRMNLYRLASVHYLVTVAELLSPGEVPLGWGLLEMRSGMTLDESLRPTFFRNVDATEWLKRIARAATRQSLAPLLKRASIGTEQKTLSTPVAR